MQDMLLGLGMAYHPALLVPTRPRDVAARQCGNLVSLYRRAGTQCMRRNQQLRGVLEFLITLQPAVMDYQALHVQVSCT